MSRLWMPGVLTLALLVGAVGVEAQGPGGRGGGAGGAGGGMMMADLGRVLEVALANEETLGFSAEQVEQLAGLKVEVDRALEPHRRELDAFRGGGGRDGGGMARGGNREAMRALMQRVQEATAPHRARFQEITTPAQREALVPLLRRGPGGR